MGGLPGVRPTDFNYGNSNGLTSFPQMMTLPSKQIFSVFNIQVEVSQMRQNIGFIKENGGALMKDYK